MRREIILALAVNGIVAVCAGLIGSRSGRPFAIGAIAALMGLAIYAIPLAIAWVTLKALARVPVPMLGFVVAHGLKVLLSLVGLVLAAVWLKTEPGLFVLGDLVWVVAGFVSATVTYFFVMRKS